MGRRTVCVARGGGRDRAHSNWTHLRSAGLEPEGDFVKACHRESSRAAAGWAPFWRYLELGRYGEQLQRLVQHFPRQQVLVPRYRDLREHPAETLDRIFSFLGVPTGAVGQVPAENVTADASDSATNRLLSTALRTGSRLESLLPRPVWQRVEALLARYLQREQRPRQRLSFGQREQLVPLFAGDIDLLQRLTGESFDDWLQAARADERPALVSSGKIGTAYNSIDRPVRPPQPGARVEASEGNEW